MESEPWVLNNPAIISSIYVHEGTHIEDALASDPDIGKHGFFAGLTVSAASPEASRMTELNATTAQLRYLNAVLSLPTSQNFVTQTQIDQVNYYVQFVQNYQNKFLNLPQPKLPPIPSSW